MGLADLGLHLTYAELVGKRLESERLERAHPSTLGAGLKILLVASQGRVSWHPLPMRPERLGRYVNEFAGRHNVRPQDTADQMAGIVRGMDGKGLRYRDLVGD